MIWYIWVINWSRIGYQMDLLSSLQFLNEFELYPRRTPVDLQWWIASWYRPMDNTCQLSLGSRCIGAGIHFARNAKPPVWFKGSQEVDGGGGSLERWDEGVLF